MKNVLFFLLTNLVSGMAASGQQPCKSTVVGDLRIEHLQSKIYGNSVTLRIWLPPGYSDAANGTTKYPILYMLDGQNAFDECTAFNGEHELQIDETVTKLVSEQQIPPIIVVGIDSSSKRNYEYSPYRDPISDPRAPEPIGKQLPSFLADEVVPFVSSRYRVSDDPAHTGIGGTSLGASAALYVALDRPDRDIQAISQPPSGARLGCRHAELLHQGGLSNGSVHRDKIPGTTDNFGSARTGGRTIVTGPCRRVADRSAPITARKGGVDQVRAREPVGRAKPR